jgi:hypothetical protein
LRYAVHNAVATTNGASSSAALTTPSIVAVYHDGRNSPVTRCAAANRFSNERHASSCVRIVWRNVSWCGKQPSSHAVLTSQHQPLASGASRHSYRWAQQYHSTSTTRPGGSRRGRRICFGKRSGGEGERGSFSRFVD